MTNLVSDLALKAPLASPVFTGDPQAPNPAVGDNDTSIATTKFVKDQAYITASALTPYAPLASPTFTGDPKAPTPATADNDTSIATTAYVKAQGYVTSSGVTSVTGTAPVVSSGGNTPAISMPAATTSVSGHLTSADWNTFNGKAPLASPTFTGDPKAPTPATADNDTSIATTAYVKAQGYGTGTVTGVTGTAPVVSSGGATPAISMPAATGSVAGHLTAANWTTFNAKVSEAPNDGVQYVRQSTAWAPVTVPPGTIISDTPPGSPANGQMWFESDTGNTYIWYADADSSQWVQINVSTLPANAVTKTAQPYNRVVNGAMQHSQELGDSGTATANAYFADQWVFGPATITAASASRVSNVAGDPSGNRFALAAIVNTAKPSLAATDHLYLMQPIEGLKVSDLVYGTASAKQVVLRFTILSPIAGTFCVSIRNFDGTRSYLAEFVISAGEANTWVIKSLVIPGDTTGTWKTDASVGLFLAFVFACGTTYYGVTGWQAGNKLGTANTTNFAAAVRTVYITNVALYLDPNNTGQAPEWQIPDYAQEATACQRYWEQGQSGVDAYNLAGGPCGTYQSFFIAKRVIPAMTAATQVNSNCSATPTLDLVLNRGFRSYRVATATGGVGYREIWTANARM
ncbi:MAG: hypothetical protein ABWY64_19945 [Tardiphaga sp.]